MPVDRVEDIPAIRFFMSLDDEPNCTPMNPGHAYDALRELVGWVKDLQGDVDWLLSRARPEVEAEWRRKRVEVAATRKYPRP